MTFRRMLFVASVLAVVISVGAWAAGFGSENSVGAQGPGGGDDVNIQIAVDQVEMGEIIHSGVVNAAGGCDIGVRTIEIEGTLSEGELSEEISVVLNDDCQLVVESIEREFGPWMLARRRTTTSQCRERRRTATRTGRPTQG